MLTSIMTTEQLALLLNYETLASMVSYCPLIRYIGVGIVCMNKLMLYIATVDREYFGVTEVMWAKCSMSFNFVNLADKQLF